MRLIVFSTIAAVFVAGLTLSTPIGEVSGTVSATATVTQPVGIIALPPGSASPRELRFGLLSPRVDGLNIEINGISVRGTRQLSKPHVAEITCPSQIASGAPFISIIYTAN